LKNFTDKQKITGSTGYNRRLAQWRVTWLIEHSTSHQLLWCIDSLVLRNPPLRQAPKRSVQSASLLALNVRAVGVVQSQSGLHLENPGEADPPIRMILTP